MRDFSHNQNQNQRSETMNPKLITFPFFIVVVLVILQVLDICMTRYGLHKGLFEMNPLYQIEIFPLKILLPIIVFFVYLLTLTQLNEIEQYFAQIAVSLSFGVVVVFYIIVITWNLYVLVKGA